MSGKRRGESSRLYPLDSTHEFTICNFVLSRHFRTLTYWSCSSSSAVIFKSPEAMTNLCPPSVDSEMSRRTLTLRSLIPVPHWQ